MKSDQSSRPWAPSSIVDGKKISKKIGSLHIEVEAGRPTEKAITGMEDFRNFLKYVNEYAESNPDVIEADKRNGCCIDIVQVYAMLMEAYEGRKPIEYLEEFRAE